jgi:hypothetical protein
MLRNFNKNLLDTAFSLDAHKFALLLIVLDNGRRSSVVSLQALLDRLNVVIGSTRSLGALHATLDKCLLADVEEENQLAWSNLSLKLFALLNFTWISKKAEI